MPRLLFTIVAAASGWQLYEGEYGRNWFETLGDARENAKLLAATLHQHHGIPTAVVIEMTSNESVLLARHG
ncbi:hypothetical protein OVA13_12305 [Pseudoxanthomonas sp. SL93]|uniref:hypothetical protein n=1 Tax=Pseudoxanthomonas sp. SL93 TaxID=2995142 RepID=UPI002271077A|nr:hypothetical protein [Pseudoxanthomonas sp. SL93]WAC62178.1 hypothetical protein OVA13_12305 [Pseudoxanthomonas sp. SL93]